MVKIFLPLYRLPVQLMTASYDVQKLLLLISSYLSIIGINSWKNEVRKSLPELHVVLYLVCFILAALEFHGL